MLVAGVGGIAIIEAAASGELLQARVEQSGEESFFKSLVEVADFP